MEEEGRKGNETQHEVTISKSYYLGVFEVTQGEYEKVMGNNPSHFKGRQLPVETVSWEDAVSFCKNLSELPEEQAAARVYRLPTEAEWEYAYRAGSKTSYSFGSFGDSVESLKDYAWFDKNALFHTYPGGEKKANAWGLYDMHGNVYEWCQDWYVDYLSSAVTDPQGSSGGSSRVLRGGCWLSEAPYCRSAARRMLVPTASYETHGFRVALSPSVK